MVSVGALSTALMRSDVHHRGEAVLDQLTGMLNRKGLQTRAAELEQQSRLINQPIGLIVADIDHFKRVNDERGHPEGDAVLVDVSYVMRKELRAFDLAYRVGGEEFVLLLPGAGIDQARVVAQGLRKRIAEAPVGSGFHVTMSFGVSASRAGQPFEYEVVFAAADGALLDAKRNGRNQVQWRAVESAAGAPEQVAALPADAGRRRLAEPG